MGGEMFRIMEKGYREAIRGKKAKIDLRNFEKKIVIESQRRLSEEIPGSEKNNNSPFQVIDFFSGCGGMSLGFLAVSKIFPFFEVVGGVDIDTDAAKSFKKNFGAPCIEADIRKLADDDEKLKKTLKKFTKYDKNKPLIVIGCAPCQGFSAYRKKNWGRDDNRNTLVGTFASIAVKLNPDCIVMENVPELLSKKYWEHFMEASKIFQEHGYKVKQAIYNTASFGVPQKRFRAIVIAMKQNFTMPVPILESKEYLTVRKAIGVLPPVKAGEIYPRDRFHRSAKHREETIKIITAIPKNGGSREPGIGPKCLDKVNGFYDVYGRLHWDKPSITITHYSRNPASGRFIHPEQDRGLTMREASILQSFPKNFEFEGAFDSVFKQIGEAVPPKFSCGIATSILINLLSELDEKDIKKDVVKIIRAPIGNSYSSEVAKLGMM